MRYAGMFLLLVSLAAGAGCKSMTHRHCCHAGQCQQCGGCEQCGMPCQCGGHGGLLGRTACHNCDSCSGDYRTGLHGGRHGVQPGCERGGLFERLWGGYCGCRGRRGAGGPGGPGGPGGAGDRSQMGLGPAPAPDQSGAFVGYPYYTTRGPRDFLLNNPPSIGPY